MPKMKTHSGAKKRFKITGTGKVVHKGANSRHLLRNKPQSSKRKLRGTHIMSAADTPIVLKWLPYGKKGA